MTDTPSFMLCDFLNRDGERNDRIFICTDQREHAAAKLRLAINSRTIVPLLDVWKADAQASGKTTDQNDAALALNAYLREIEDNRIPIREAVRVASISINFSKPLSIAKIMPALEQNHGGKAVSWARGIFRPLRLGPPHIN